MIRSSSDEFAELATSDDQRQYQSASNLLLTLFKNPDPSRLQVMRYGRSSIAESPSSAYAKLLPASPGAEVPNSPLTVSNPLTSELSIANSSTNEPRPPFAMNSVANCSFRTCLCSLNSTSFRGDSLPAGADGVSRGLRAYARVASVSTASTLGDGETLLARRQLE